MPARLETFQNKLIVSVQAEAHEPLAPTPILKALCESVLSGGASGLRVANLELIRQLRTEHPDLPIIGLSKPEPLPPEAKSCVYITATLDDALALAEAGASIVATDATLRPRPDGKTLAEFVSAFRAHAPKEVALMADISTLEEGLNAYELGFELIGTTLSGYTEHSQSASTEPDFALLEALVARYPGAAIILEGRVNQPQQVSRAFKLGAYSVVVGSAITRPHLLTRQFCDALPS